MSDPPGVEELYANLDLTIQVEELQRQLERVELFNMLLLAQPSRTDNKEESNNLNISKDDTDPTDHSKDSVKEDDENPCDDNTEPTLDNNEEVSVKEDTFCDKENQEDDNAEDFANMNVTDLQNHAEAMEVERERLIQMIPSLEDRVHGLEREIKDLDCQNDANKLKIQAFEALFCAMNEQAHESGQNSGSVAKGLPDKVDTLIETSCDSSSLSSSSICGPVEI